MHSAFSHNNCARKRFRCLERGYALLSILAGLTISLVILASALPSVQHETQREREEDLFGRGRQVAMALGAYRIVYGRFPLKLEELLNPPEIVGQQPGAKFRLRSSASIDPMTNSEWIPIREGDARITKFVQTVQAYMLQDQKNFPPQLLSLVPRSALLSNTTEASADAKETESENTPQSGDNRPIIGIVSRSKKKLIRNYYGIETYDQALILTAVCGGPGNCQVLRMPGADQYPGLPLGEQAGTLPLQPPTKVPDPGRP
jgi:type II secretory pathway pseudopilin PulG